MCRYGITRVIEGGDLLEKAAINISIIHGQLTETRAKAGCCSDYSFKFHEPNS